MEFNKQFDLQGKSALVTGASSGLGLHFSHLLARAGARVALAARRKDLLDHTVRDIENNGGAAIAVPVDVTNDEEVEMAFTHAGEALDGIDIVVNNAGIASSAFFVDVSFAEWRKVMDVNLDGVFRVGQMAARKMSERGEGGSIINIASVAGLVPVRLLSAYSASKAAVVQMTRSMALELVQERIRVNALAPGYFTTDINRDYLASPQGEKLLSKIPYRRAGELEELSGPFMLLASDASSYMTGTILTVDGGVSLSLG